MSVPKGFTIAVPMPFATIPKGLITAHAGPDSLGMAENAKVQASVNFCTHLAERIPIKELSDENVNALQ